MGKKRMQEENEEIDCMEETKERKRKKVVEERKCKWWKKENGYGKEIIYCRDMPGRPHCQAH